MKKFVFSHFSRHTDELTSKIIESDKSALEVVIDELIGHQWDFSDEEIKSIEDLKNFAFKCDEMIEIIEV